MSEPYEFQVCCDPGQGMPMPNGVVVNTAVPPGRIERILLRVPPGPNGEVYFYLAMAGETIFPRRGDLGLVLDDASLDYYPPPELSSGAWQVIIGNSGSYRHCIYVTYFVVVSKANAAGGLSPLNLTGVDVAG